MSRVLAILVIAVSLAGCDAVNTVTEGFKEARVVENELEQSTGLKPQVGFNWNNGRLRSVTVIYPRLQERPLPEVAEAVRTAVGHAFKQTPEAIVLGFTLQPTQGKPTQSNT